MDERRGREGRTEGSHPSEWEKQWSDVRGAIQPVRGGGGGGRGVLSLSSGSTSLEGGGGGCLPVYPDGTYVAFIL